MNVMDNKGLDADERRWQQAVEWFLRVRSDDTRGEDLPLLQRWMEADPQNALAYQQVSATWNTVGLYASAPEIVKGRLDALEDSHNASRKGSSLENIAPARFGRVLHAGGRRGWAVAACAAVLLVAATWGFIWPRSVVYTTDLGEERTLVLPDHSMVTLDAHSRARVRFTDQERVVSLEQGQARFMIAKDPLRPFRVHVRGQTVVALGTQFDIELVSHTVLVTLIEGHVAVAGVPSETGPGKSPKATTRELVAGEALHVGDDGHAVLLAHVDLARATAWETGQIFFDNEPLCSAVERVNRYSRKQIEVDESVGGVSVSGVFHAGDTNAFIEAVTAYFPVDVDRRTDSTIHLTLRRK